MGVNIFVENDKAVNNRSESEVQIVVKVMKVVEKWLGEEHTIQLNEKIEDELIRHLREIHNAKIEGDLNTLIFEWIHVEAQYYKEQQMQFAGIKRPVYSQRFGDYLDDFGRWQSIPGEANLCVVMERSEQFLNEMCEAAGHPEWEVLLRID